MKQKNTSPKVIRIPVMFPVVVAIIIAVIATVIIGTELIKNAARYKAVNSLTTADGNFEYQVLEDDTIEITKYLGIASDVIIPETIDGKVVTSIGKSAFEYYDNLKSVEIPEGVTTIGEFAFYECWKLKSIDISENVTNIGKAAFAGAWHLQEINVAENNEKYSSENGILFNKEKTMLIQYPVAKMDTEYIIPEEVTSIGEWAFAGCFWINEIVIPKGVTSIGEAVFKNCGGLTNLQMPEEITKIGKEAFYGCRDLETIKIPSTVTEIESDAFIFCEKLTNIEIPRGVTKINFRTFGWCTNLKTVNIPDTVTEISNSAFYNCINLTEIHIPSSVTKLEGYVFQDCKKLTKIEIPNTIEEIEAGMFMNCISLNDVTIPEGVKTISYGAFGNCSSLSSIVLPASLETIESTAFCGTNLTVVEIPENVNNISGDIFGNCANLKSINVSAENSVYKSADGVLFDYEMTELVRYPEGKENTQYELPESVENIMYYAFFNCRNLKKINVSTNNVNYKSIDGVLVNSEMTEIVKYPKGKEDTEYEIPNGITSINDHAFENCTNLKSIVISKDVSYIGDYAFAYCTNLKNVVIPKDVLYIGYMAFGYCTNLENVEILTTEADIYYGVLEGSIINKVTSEKEIELPNIIKRAMDEDDILYSNTGFELINCTFNENKTKLILNEEIIDRAGTALYINSGILMGVSFEIFEPGEISYSRTYMAEEPVTVILHLLEGATITNNNGNNTYTFTKNGDFTFEYIDVDGTAKTATAKVRNIGEEGEEIEIEITSEKYEINDSYISKISPKVTVEDIKEQLETNATEINVYNKDGEIQEENAKLATGMKIEFNLNEQAENFTVVILGDTNGDGKADFKDLTKINSHRLNKKALEAEYLLAADVNGDGKVDFKDLVKVNKYRLSKITEM